MAECEAEGGTKVFFPIEWISDQEKQVFWDVLTLPDFDNYSLSL